jgi:hypothetical protein
MTGCEGMPSGSSPGERHRQLRRRALLGLRSLHDSQDGVSYMDEGLRTGRKLVEKEAGRGAKFSTHPANHRRLHPPIPVRPEAVVAYVHLGVKSTEKPTSRPT